MNKTLEKTDLRVRRTRKLLWEAMLELLENRTFDSLNIQEICDKAMVHRTTFYKHFEDKYQLLTFGLEEVRKQFPDRTYEDRMLHPMKLAHAIGLTKQFQGLANSARENPTLSCVLQQHGEDTLIRELREFEKTGRQFPVPIEVIAAFYSGAVSSLMAWWLKNGQTVPVDELDRYWRQLIHQPTFFPARGE